MGNSSGSMLYMVVLLIIIYVVGMGIYQGVKFIQKKREEAKDKKFREEGVNSGIPVTEIEGLRNG